VVDNESTFEMCYMVTKLPKRIRATGRTIRIERSIQEFSYVENLMRRRYPVKISAYII
jgi:hypothetical protein